MTVAAGQMHNRVRFEREGSADDGYGNTGSGGWSTQLECWAAFAPQKGAESLEAGRLESTMRGVLTVRRSAETLALTAGDRAVFIAGPFTGRTANIRSIVPIADNATIQIVCEEGVAT